MRTGYLPKEERKKILFLADDMRTHSGVGTMAREIIEGTCHRFNWIQVGAAVNNPDTGKILDMSEALKKITDVEDPFCQVYPYQGYGDSRIVRYLMEKEKPDAILHFTDPRYWQWLYQIEHELRQEIPMFFYGIWDDLPFPYYNEPYYRSDDWIGAISKQTYNIVKQVCRKEPRTEHSLTYLPHGINTKKFYPITPDMVTPADPENPESVESGPAVELGKFREFLYNGEDIDFSVLFISRNIQRKHPSDIMLAFNHFLAQITPEEAAKCRLIMHTMPIEDHGTDLITVNKDVVPDVKIIWSQNRVPFEQINLMYNLADVTINISSNEGFGLGTCESLMAGTPIIVNVTGGLQDQCGFKDENGEYLTENHFDETWGSNHDGRYKEHGEWAFPIFPVSISLQGSPLTPYIFDDRADWKEAGDKMLEVYRLTREERKRRGESGRKFLIEDAKFTSEDMCQSFIDDMENAWEHFTPRKKFELIEA